MIYHMCMHLDAAFDMVLGIGAFGRSGKDKISRMFDMSSREIYSEIKRMQAEGMTAIPGEGCDNHNGGVCQGHQKPRSVAEYASSYHGAKV